MKARFGQLRTPRLIAVLATIACVAAACGGSSSNPGTANKIYKIGVLYPTLNDPFFVAQQQGVHAAAQEFGATIIDLGANNDAATQTTQMENLIAQHVDGILLQPADVKGILGAVGEANTANIPVDTVGEATPGAKIVTAAYFDEVQDGRNAADILMKSLPAGAKVAELLGLQGTTTAAQRQQGFDQQASTDGLNLVAKQPADFDRTKGLSVTEAILRAHPDLQGLWAQNDEMALGALKAVSEAGKQGKIVVVGTNGDPGAIAALQTGEMTATIALPPYQQGFMGIEALVMKLKGKKVCSVITEKAVTVTKDNVTTVKPQLITATPDQRYWDSCFT